MPVQQAVDVAVPVETAYNQWTQFEDWPEFMHRVTRVTKDDDCTVSFATKIWGKTKEFTAAIDTQRPDERIKWRVSQGITHTGVVTFHELAPRLTRIEVNVDVVPGSLLEKAARGMRHIKRAMRADLHRFKAFIEMQELETGAWRGVIEDGELVEEHPEDYDAQRDYGDIEDATAGADEDSPDEDFERSESDDTEDEPEEPEAEEPDDTEDEPEEPEAEEPSRRAKTSGRRKAATDAS
jgi:cobalamin biosynthesis protein CobT